MDPDDRGDKAPYRPCAFYQAELPPRQYAPGAVAPPARLLHRCILNSGKAAGPDGNPINALECTPARQAKCQANRRHMIATLHATHLAPATSETRRGE